MLTNSPVPDPIKNPHLAHVYAQSTVEQKRTLYKEWAETYDDELKDDLGYVGPATAVELFCDYVPQRDALVH